MSDNQITLHHIGGRKHICPSCSDGLKEPRKCMYFNADTSLTRYAFSCGYIEWNKSKKLWSKNLSMEHGVFHVKGFDVHGTHVWQSFRTLKEARAYLRKP